MTTESTWAQVSSSDLFDGDILGDELIDIYNAVGGEDDAMVQGMSEEWPDAVMRIVFS